MIEAAAVVNSREEREDTTMQGRNVSSSDEVACDDSAVEIDVFQSGGLIAFARMLAERATRADEEQEVACFATATVLIAAAALEALLSEFAYISNRSAYTKEFRKAGVPKKYCLLRGRDCGNDKGKALENDHPAASELWAHRIAIGHSEPDDVRSRSYGSRIDKPGARWAAETVVSFARALWGTQMPDWLRSDSGL